MYADAVTEFFTQITFFDTLGLIGALSYIVGYALLQFGFIIGRGVAYPAFNLAASGLILVSLIDKFNMASAISQSLWVSLSIFGIARIFLASRFARFNAEEEDMLAAKHIQLPRYLARKLLNLGEWRDAPAGTVLTEQGRPVSHLYFLAQGEADATRNGGLLSKLGPKSYIGELVCLTGEPAVATVTLTADSRLFTIASDKLKRFISREGDIAEAIESSIVQEMAGKVTGSAFPWRNQRTS
jgi:Cyclic nucleotide-binding domain